MSTPTVPPTMTIGRAFKTLGLVGSVSSSQEIVSAFRSRVRSAADGTGGFRGDMDVLTQAKEFLLAALARAQEEAQKEQVRKNAQEAERKEKERQKKRAQKKAPTKTEPLRLLGEATSASRYHEAILIFEWKREVAHRANAQIQEQQGVMMKSDKSKQTLATPQNGQIVGVLSLFQERDRELEEIRQKEQEILQELSRIQARRAELEKVVQTASTLTEQLRTILESVAQ